MAQPGWRRRRLDTPPQEPAAPRFTRTVSSVPMSDSSLRAAASIAYLIAALAAIGAVIGGIVLLHYSPAACHSCTPTHPLRATGWVVLTAGLVQAALIALLARVSEVAARNRDALNMLFAELER